MATRPWAHIACRLGGEDTYPCAEAGEATMSEAAMKDTVIETSAISGMPNFLRIGLLLMRGAGAVTL
ncbi:hypothetical protein Pme01_25540 [Planosporangium mesophilum]|uniref:Uncharacterized protein n=1 Tax=Planosporangium mesophilum TaxID=689768 RepID=A0A8J3X061_9ACTN|nr:hypothetical protein Pme01_25540 [Planosporangium mesophilum]